MRASLADLHIRGDGRTVVGLAVPFDTWADIVDDEGVYRERFRQGAFAKTIAQRGDRVKALALHDRRRLPLGRAHSLREDAHGFVAELRISQTREGDEALELVRDGALDALSIGFRPVEGGSEWNRDRTEVDRTEVRLNEISLVAFPAYEDARILAVRHTADGLQVDCPPATTEAPSAPGSPVTDGTADEPTSTGGIRQRVAVKVRLAQSKGVAL